MQAQASSIRLIYCTEMRFYPAVRAFDSVKKIACTGDL